MYWFTADTHFGHAKILQYCNRPFDTIEEHDDEIIDRFNSMVSEDDIIVFAGDICWENNYREANRKYLQHINGTHIYLNGSHDHWLPSSTRRIWRKRIDGQLIVVCHFAMRLWESSHFNTWHVYGHSHGHLPGQGKSFDIGVDSHNFYPWSWNEIVKEMEQRL